MALVSRAAKRALAAVQGRTTAGVAPVKSTATPAHSGCVVFVRGSQFVLIVNA